MRNLSLGYRTLIAWMVDLASRLFERYPESPNPLAEPAVVLVDEIDLHLHPTWQRQLIGYLTERFPNTQFIVTAHSPLVVQSATDANIVVLKREGDHVVIDNDVESIRGWRVDQLLTSDLFGLETARPPQLEDFLKARTALLSKPRLTKKDEARGKCAFCESQLAHISYGDVEHFRPKAGWRQEEGGPLGRPGYYWLAYEWTNLFLACTLCNQQFKRNLFPLRTPSRRARSHSWLQHTRELAGNPSGVAITTGNSHEAGLEGGTTCAPRGVWLPLPLAHGR
nr:AAA family ATPase [Archangium violaceum]